MTVIWRKAQSKRMFFWKTMNCGSGHTCVTLQNWHNENLAVKRRKFETVADMLYCRIQNCSNCIKSRLICQLLPTILVLLPLSASFQLYHYSSHLYNYVIIHCQLHALCLQPQDAQTSPQMHSPWPWPSQFSWKYTKWGDKFADILVSWPFPLYHP